MNAAAGAVYIYTAELVASRSSTETESLLGSTSGVSQTSDGSSSALNSADREMARGLAPNWHQAHGSIQYYRKPQNTEQTIFSPCIPQVTGTILVCQATL